MRTSPCANAAHHIIRDELRTLFGNEVASATRILYGGSVSPDNCVALMGEPEIDGLLIGGASLKPETFAAIIKSSHEAGK